MDDETAKLAIIQTRWRLWYTQAPYLSDRWLVQRKTWYGGWTTIARVYSNIEAESIKQTLMRQDICTTRLCTSFWRN